MRIGHLSLFSIALSVLASTGLSSERVTYALSYHVEEGVKPPNLIQSPLPSFTEAARKAEPEDRVVHLECVVTAEGKVKEAQITRAAGYGLDAAALEAVTKHWLFEPARYQGQPVEVKVGASIMFHLYLSYIEAHMDEPADVDRLRLEGNHLFTEAQLRSTLQEKLKVLPTIRNQDVEDAIRNLYQAHGYIKVDLRWLPENVLRIQEEKPFRLRRLEIRNARAFPVDYLLSLFELKSGDRVDFSKIRNGLEKIRQLYGSAGFLNWSYMPEQTIDDLEGEVDITFTFDESIWIEECAYGPSERCLSLLLNLVTAEASVPDRLR